MDIPVTETLVYLLLELPVFSKVTITAALPQSSGYYSKQHVYLRLTVILTERRVVERQTYTLGVQTWISNGVYRALHPTKYHMFLWQLSGPHLLAFCLSYLLQGLPCLGHVGMET